MKNEPFYELFINHRIESIAEHLRGLNPLEADTVNQPNYVHAVMQASLLEHDFENEFSLQPMREPIGRHSLILAARIFGSSLSLVNPIISIPLTQHPSQPYRGVTMQLPEPKEVVYRGIDIHYSEQIGDSVPAFFGPHIHADLELHSNIHIEVPERESTYFLAAGNYETYIPMRGLIIAAHERFSKLN